MWLDDASHGAGKQENKGGRTCLDKSLKRRDVYNTMLNKTMISKQDSDINYISSHYSQYNKSYLPISILLVQEIPLSQ